MVNLQYFFPQKEEDQWQMKLQMEISMVICIGSQETLRLQYILFFFILLIKDYIKLKIPVLPLPPLSAIALLSIK